MLAISSCSQPTVLYLFIKAKLQEFGTNNPCSEVNISRSLRLKGNPFFLTSLGRSCSASSCHANYELSSSLTRTSPAARIESYKTMLGGRL